MNLFVTAVWANAADDSHLNVKQCDLCKLGMEEAKKYLQQVAGKDKVNCLIHAKRRDHLTTLHCFIQAKIKAALPGMCQKATSFKATCEKFIKEDSDHFINMMAGDVHHQHICTKRHWC